MRVKLRGGIALLACVGLLTACSSERVEVTGPNRPNDLKPQSSGVAKNRYVTVQPGQSLGRLAAAYHVPMQEIIAANGLAPPYHLKTGMRLAIPVTGEPVRTAARPKPAAARTAAANEASNRPADRTSTKRNHPTPEVIPLDDPAPTASAEPHHATAAAAHGKAITFPPPSTTGAGTQQPAKKSPEQIPLD